MVSPVNSSSEKTLELTGRLGDETFETAISDPHVITAVRHCGDNDLGDGVAELLRMASRIVTANATDIDVQAVHEELERAAQATVGAVTAAVEGAVGEDSIFTAAVQEARNSLVSSVRQEILAQTDPDTAGTLLAKIQASSRQFDEALMKKRNELLGDLQRAAREMRALDESSELGQAVARLEKKLQDLAEKVAASKDVAAERARGHLKGLEYEDQVAAAVAEVAGTHGDVAEHTGNRPGFRVGAKGASKRGDVTCVVSEDARIVFEAMDRGNPSEREVKAELREAMENRAAQVAIAVLSSADKCIMCAQPFVTLGPAMYAVVLDSSEHNTLALRLAYCLARREVQAHASAGGAVDLKQVRKHAQQIQQRLASLDSVIAPYRNIASLAEKGKQAVDVYRRDVEAALSELLAAVEQNAESNVAA